jgi:hypothetical protein
LLMVTSRGPGTERNVRDGNGISPQQLEPRASGRAPVSTDATGQLQQSVSASAQVAVSACHRTLEFTWPAPGGVEGSPAAAGGRRQAAGMVPPFSWIVLDSSMSCQMPHSLYYCLFISLERLNETGERTITCCGSINASINGGGAPCRERYIGPQRQKYAFPSCACTIGCT